MFRDILSCNSQIYKNLSDLCIAVAVFAGKRWQLSRITRDSLEKGGSCSGKPAKKDTAISASADSGGSVTRLISLLDTDSLQSPVFR